MTLAIDSSGHGGAIALATAGEVRGVVRHDPAEGYAESMFGMIDTALERAGASTDDIDRLAVVQGPGSFTGLRIGVMTAKTVAFARSTPLYAASTLELLAHAGRSHDAGSWLTVQAAGRGAAYVARFDAAPQPVVAATRVTLEDLPAWVRDHGADASIVSQGDLHDAVSTDLAVDEFATGLARVASTGTWPAQAVEPAALMPLYLTPSQAERVHGVDLSDAVHRPLPPRSWGSS